MYIDYYTVLMFSLIVMMLQNPSWVLAELDMEDHALNCGITDMDLLEIMEIPHVEGILPKGPYLPCVSMAGRALLAGYPRCMCDEACVTKALCIWKLWYTCIKKQDPFIWLCVNPLIPMVTINTIISKSNVQSSSKWKCYNLHTISLDLGTYRWLCARLQ